MHVLPRWVADPNFMTVIGETRVFPESLGTTYQRLKSKLRFSVGNQLLALNRASQRRN